MLFKRMNLGFQTWGAGSYDNHGSVVQNIDPLFASSLFFQALGLRPSKDNAATMHNTRGGHHPNPELETLVAVLTTGPVVCLPPPLPSPHGVPPSTCSMLDPPVVPPST